MKVREIIIESIVATDMKFHFKHIENANKFLETSVGLQDFKVLKYLCSLILHCTDLSHATKKSQTAEKWARLVSVEFTNIYN